MSMGHDVMLESKEVLKSKLTTNYGVCQRDKEPTEGDFNGQR